MCIAIPCQIVEFIDSERHIALGDFLGVKREINVQLIEELDVGDYVIVHVGYAIQKLDVEEALENIKTLKEIDGLNPELNF
jgi:hydrogenase expression/formation protein HypC